MESQEYMEIGGWWKAVKGQEQNPQEIDIVTVDINGTPYAYEVKRNREKYSAAEFEPKVMQMSNKLFGGRKIEFGCLSMEDM